jgi:hypothetical protein
VVRIGLDVDRSSARRLDHVVAVGAEVVALEGDPERSRGLLSRRSKFIVSCVP